MTDYSATRARRSLHHLIFSSLRKGIWRLKRLFVLRYLRLTGVHYGEGLRVFSLPYCRVHPGSTVRLGSGITINNRLVENPAGIMHRSVLVTAAPGASLVVGDHVGISGAVLYCRDSITIEDYVNLGAGCLIYDSDHHPVQHLARRSHDVRQIRTAPVRICRDAFVGARAIILKGVTVGERSIVGAGSVVVRDVPADTIVSGVPAVVVKSLEPPQSVDPPGGCRPE